ncbi:EthD domain-containing protein [Nocardia sp. 348MFTsu5.1]|uniref:EthD domain-containing protein n=1 Tax=Nocardia sp. 348MFTsu5.1 TaxID=1172185 RepID=UPI00037356A5|nr:EthD domain-containing protein [Nocardia sp. 348MFTsu5.1]
MIKIVFCLRRKSGLSQEEFSRYWLEEHAPLVRRHAAALGIRRYVQCHTFDDPRLASTLAARGCEGEPYDGVAELWWDSTDDLAAVRGSDAGRTAGKALLEDERTFIDLTRSRIFFTEEHTII